MQSVPLSRYLAFAAIALGGCAADLLSKHWVFEWLGMPEASAPWWIVPEIFGFQTSINQGALFGIGWGYMGVFAALSVLAAVGVVYWLFVAGAARDWLLTIALSCVMAGVLGNLYDRLGLWNEPGGGPPQRVGVRDWILVQYNGWVWPNFNLADSLLVCGAALLMWHAFRNPAATAASAPDGKQSVADVE